MVRGRASDSLLTRKPPHRLEPVGGDGSKDLWKGASMAIVDDQSENALELVSFADPLDVYGGNAYLPWEFIHFNLPYRRPSELVWTRQNSNLTFEVVAGRVRQPNGEIDRFVPYGKHARAALLWMCTEAKKTNDPHLELGSSYSEFLRKLGMTTSGGQSRSGHSGSVMKSTLSQLRALFAATISVSSDTEDPDGRLHMQDLGYRITSSSELWFSHRDASEVDSLLPSTVTLSSDLFASILEHGMPVNLDGWRAIQSASKSPLALDVYVWLCARLHNLKGVGRPTWEQLQAQFGSQTTRKEFVRLFKGALDIALQQYPQARVAERVDSRGRSLGLELRPSPPAVSPRDSR